MQPMIEKAVEAHKAGKLKEAEALYRAILEDQPQHPDANHNLGVLAVSVNQLAAALPLLKTALEANPKQGQYWISYVDALIRNHQPETARVVLEQGKEMGLAGEQVDTLSQQLASRSAEPETSKTQSPTFTQQRKRFSAKKEKRNASSVQRSSGQASSPSMGEINDLLAQYQKGQYTAAEKLATAMTHKHPDHQFGWKLLGAVFQATGRVADSVLANKKAVVLAPEDAEAHSNLGNALKDLGQLQDAETSYRQAIVLKPDFAEAQSNLGVTLMELGRLEEAEVTLKRAIKLKPDFEEAHYNLGIILKEVGRIEEAEASCRQATVLKPVYAEAHYNLGVMLRALGRVEEAEASCRQAIVLKPDSADAHNTLAVILKELGRLEDAEASYRQAITLKPDFAEAYNNLGSTLGELGQLEDAEASYRQAIALKPNYAEFRYNLGVLLYDSRQYKSAAEQLVALDFQKSKSYLLQCLYHQGSQSLFNQQLECAIDSGENNSLIGSLCSRSKLNYGGNVKNPFCENPFKFIRKTNLTEGFDFGLHFVKVIKNILSDESLSSKSQGQLINGQQTAGNLFYREADSMKEIERIIRSEIKKYYFNFEGSEEGLITQWPDFYDLKGWLIDMRNGGMLRPHIHEGGWISGSIYINVPPKIKDNSGNLVLCINEGDYEVADVKNPSEIIDVITGDLVLFPSSLMHYTIPFESEERRIVLAFDVMRKRT